MLSFLFEMRGEGRYEVDMNITVAEIFAAYGPEEAARLQESWNRLILKWMPTTNQEMQQKTLALMTALTPAQRLAGLTPQEILTALTPAQRLAGLTPQEILAGLTPEQLLVRLTPEEILAGLTLKQILTALTPKQLLTLQKQVSKKPARKAKKTNSLG